MSMLRQDPLSGRWVIFAAGRSARPNEFPVLPRDPRARPDCPFCPGQEGCTTPEVLALGRAEDAPANAPGWRLRAFPNLYPALSAAGPPTEGELDGGTDGVADGVRSDHTLFRQTAGRGRHEVVVYSPDHGSGPASIGPTVWAELLGVLQSRAQDMARDPEVRYVSPFCNHGPEAGATLAHPHMQIIGAPRVPSLAATKAARQQAYHRAHGGCLLCDLAEAERQAGQRLVSSSDAWTVWAPWASRFPWELLLVPRRHGASFLAATAFELETLAACLAQALAGLSARHGDLSLNLVLHSAEVDAGGEDHDDGSYHWHLEVLPRLSRPAGFEVGTGYTINAVLPEEAASWLRRESERT